MLKLSFLLYLLLISNLVLATTSSTNQSLQSLAQSSQWQRLLHYNLSSAFRHESEVDDRRFFLSDNGKYSSVDELIVSIKKLQSDPQAKCQFPARYEWLARQLNWPLTNIFEECAELNEWYHKIDANFVTLAFPASYMNSPSSMFGHLFLRVDSREQENNLLAYSINYGANVENDDNSFTFTYKGLTGGYPGTVSVLPYYEKVKEYNDIENRDIWEYTLNLNAAETRRMILHIWELKNIQFDYYFVDENCAYRILSLIEVARPSIDVLKFFYTRAVPSDVVKRLEDSGIFSTIRFRPSLATELQQSLEQLSEVERNWVLLLHDDISFIDSPSFQQLSVTKQAKILEVATYWLRFNLADAPESQSRRDHGYQYLLARSKIDLDSPLNPVKAPTYRSDQGHDTFHLSLGMLERATESFASILFRPAYHKLTDPLAGYLEGAQINFIETELLINNDLELSLNALTLLDLISVTPRDEFFSPLSWSVKVGVERLPSSNFKSALFALSNAGAGVSYGSPKSQFYIMGVFQALNNDEQLTSTAVQLGARSGWLLYGDESQSWLEFESLVDTSRAQFDQKKLKLSHSLNLSTHHALNFHFERIKLDTFYYSEAGVYYRYFM